MRKLTLFFTIFLFAVSLIRGQQIPATQGTLNISNEKGEIVNVPLKHTNVKAEISGFLARVKVQQEFVNNFSEPIEAVYTFPLSQDSAVDDMTMTIGSRTIKGKILKREEARKVYENAKSRGQTASLLDQERPNIFTQSVANILPNEKIVIEISYVETLKYEDGSYEFVFPMVVGPRYIPGNSTGKTGDGLSLDTTQVPDASKITPMPANGRAGHDISIEVNLDAGVPIEQIRSTLHHVETQNLSPNNAKITLKNETTIPNKDFILKYDVTGKKIEDAILTHRGKNGGFFTMILQPPDKFTTDEITPKEIVFVLDTSGSMSGFPIEKAKEAMKMSLDGLHPHDTFNLITFAGDTHVLFEKPVPATARNLQMAQEFLASRKGGGGTEMMKAIKASLAPSDSQEHLRIVCFMTDGYIGNESGILSEIQKHPNARVFSFGIGNSVNRFLLDKMAEEGRGEVSYVTLDDDGTQAAKKFYERVRTPILTDISIDWNGLPVANVYPSRLSDLFSAKPVILNGRYTNAARGTIKLKGKISGQIYERHIQVNLPEIEEKHDVLATLWARQRIDELTSKGYGAANDEAAKKAMQDQITNLGLEFRLLTKFTSFVAVEERVVNHSGTNPRKISVPIEMADGVSREATKGSGNAAGSGNGVGLRFGTGNGSGLTVNAGVTQVVDVSTSGVATIDMADTSINTTITTDSIQSLPKGTTFNGILKVSPNARSESLRGGFQVDGSSGRENVFVVDGAEVTSFRTGKSNKSISSSVTELPKPEIPKKLKWNKKDSVVNVEILVDENGEVVSAKAISGDFPLRKLSETAALKGKFISPRFEGVALKMKGIVTYKFVNKKDVQISIESKNMRAELTPEIKRKLILKEKLHFWVFESVERIEQGGTTPTSNEANFVFDGKAEVQVLLTENTSEIVAKLKAVGFEVVEEKGDKIVGRIAVEKLKDLAFVEEVKYVSP